VNSNCKLARCGNRKKKGFKEILSSRSPTHASRHNPSGVPCGQTSCLSRSFSPRPSFGGPYRRRDAVPGRNRVSPMTARGTPKAPPRGHAYQTPDSKASACNSRTDKKCQNPSTSSRFHSDLRSRQKAFFHCRQKVDRLSSITWRYHLKA